MVQIDWVILIFYFLLVSFYGYWIYKRENQKVINHANFFLAKGSHIWWERLLYYLYSHNMIDPSLINSTNVAGVTIAESNKTYPALLTLLPARIKGITIAAFWATVLPSLAAKVN